MSASPDFCWSLSYSTREISLFETLFSFPWKIMGIGVWFLDNWEKTKTSSCWILDIICNYLIISLEIVEKEIIQTNNLPKNEKIQRNNSAKFEKIQRYNLKSVGQIQLEFLISERSVRGGWDVKSTSHWSQSLCCRAFQAFWVRGGGKSFFLVENRRVADWDVFE